MRERCRDGRRTSLLIAGVVLVPAIFHTFVNIMNFVKNISSEMKILKWLLKHSMKSVLL